MSDEDLLLTPVEQTQPPAQMPIPLFDYVLIKGEKELKSKSGLYMPASENYAIVVAVGPGKHVNGAFVPTSVKPGQRVALNMPEGMPIPQLRWGEKYSCVEECFLCAILPGDSPPEATRIEVPRIELQ
jgi:co-chaperonin GroES (HSP10)